VVVRCGGTGESGGEAENGEGEMESCDCVERETERQRKGTIERKRTTLKIHPFHPCPLICLDS
jgi:hypothetical protein